PGAADPPGRARDRLAPAPLQGRRADHRRGRRRDAGNARRAAPQADPQELLPRALEGAHRADRAGEGGGHVAFEELKQRLSAAWSAAPFENLEPDIAVMHDDLVQRLAPRPGERWLDVGCGPGAVGMRAAG